MVYGHGMPRNIKRYFRLIIGILTDIFYLMVVYNLLNIFVCDYSQLENPAVLRNPSLQCWQGPHIAYALLSIFCLSFYIPVVILLCPILVQSGMDENDGDIAFTRVYLVTSALLKTALIVFSSFIPEMFGIVIFSTAGSAASLVILTTLAMITVTSFQGSEQKMKR